MSTANIIKSNQKDNREKDDLTCCQFYAFICLVELCHFFTTGMLECLKCMPIIACDNVDIVLKIQ